MKRIASILLSAILAMGFVSCDSRIWDINPMNIYITVSNADGQNLLDPTTPNNFVGKAITAEWKDETYTADSLSLMDKEAVTRFYPGEMHGLMYVTQDGKQALCFGELCGHDTYEDEPFTLHWPDGSTDVINVEASADEGYRDVKLIRKFKLNGKIVANDTSVPVINIVK